MDNNKNYVKNHNVNANMLYNKKIKQVINGKMLYLFVENLKNKNKKRFLIFTNIVFSLLSFHYAAAILNHNFSSFISKFILQIV